MKNKKILIVVVIITATLLLLKVNAGTKDSTLIKNRIEGVYAIAPLSDKTHLYYLQKYTLNGITSYCIELGKDITTDIYNSTSNETEQQNITKLTKEQLNYIKAIAYFGYGYLNHNDDKYYMAAQEIIWEYLTNIDITWTSILDINGPKINIDSYKNEIIDLANRYLKKLTLTKSVLYYIGTENTLTDPNNSLEFYTAISQKKQQVTITGNTLKINIGTQNIKNDTITLTRKNYYNTQAKIYNFDDSQIMLSAGNLENEIYNINLIIKGANLTIKVIDKDTKKFESEGITNLKDTIYEIYNKDKSYDSKVTVSYPGTSKVVNLSYGTYYIKLIKPGTGYETNNTETEIIINKLDNAITLEQEIIKNNIEIDKYYESPEGNIREENITFEIYDTNNNLYKSILTSKEGPTIVTLPYGSYTIKQINTTEGYEKVEDIKLTIDKENKNNIKYKLLDKKIKVKVHITTLNKETDETIEEANIQYKISDKNNNEIYKTNKKGSIEIELPYGNYTLEQISPPKNYIKNEEKINFTIKSKDSLNIKYYNEPQKIIYKEDKVTIKKTINPKTSDKVKNNITLLIISFISLLIITFHVKKTKKK